MSAVIIPIREHMAPAQDRLQEAANRIIAEQNGAIALAFLQCQRAREAIDDGKPQAARRFMEHAMRALERKQS